MMAAPQPASNDDDLSRLLKESVAGYARSLGLESARALRETKPGYDPDVWQQAAKQGWLGTLVAESFGGSGLGLVEMAVVVRELARVLRPEPFVASAGVAASVLSAIEGGADTARLLGSVASGEGILAFVTLEDQANLPRLNGTVSHVAAGLMASGYLVFTSQAGKGRLLYVPADAPGLVCEPEPRADGTFSARLTFADVGGETVLAEGDAAENAMRRGLVAGALLTSAELLGAMEAALEMTLDYMKSRVQFDKPIGSFQALQHRAVDLFIQKELSIAVLEEAIAAAAGDDLERAEMEAARAKARVTSAALLIGREAIKLHGAIAYTDEYDAGLFLRRILSLAPQYGNAADCPSSEFLGQMAA